MHIRSEPDVVGQIPVFMVRILVDHNIVAIPEPVIAIVVIRGSNAKVNAAHREALAISAVKPEDMIGPEAARETSVLPRLAQMILRIVAAGVVANPASVVVYVGS